MRPGELAAIAISFIALGVSVATGYLTIVQQKDELRVLIADEVPDLSWQDGRLQISGKLNIVFINSGTRPIVIQSVALRINQDISGEKEFGDRHSSCGPFDETFIYFDTGAFIVKEKDAVSKLLSLKSEGGHSMDVSVEDGRISLPNPKKLDPGKTRFVITCVAILGASLSQRGLYADFKVTGFAWSPSNELSQIERFFAPGPVVVWAKQGTIFNMD